MVEAKKSWPGHQGFLIEDEAGIAKVIQKMHDRPGGGGLSRKSVLNEIDHSLKCLDLDYVDIYIVAWVI